MDTNWVGSCRNLLFHRLFRFRDRVGKQEPVNIHFNNVQAQLASHKGVILQSAAAEELRPFSGRALMPSILDKAFMEEPGVCRRAMIRDVKCQFEPLRVQRMRSFKGFLGVLRGKKTDTA